MLRKEYKPKIKLQIGENYKFVKDIVKDQNLNTVCAEANCPNIYECWNRGTATLMILGDTCTRACGFCAVKTGKPTWDDPLEPMRTALAVKKMQLKHVVITSVDRDDLKGDYGASIWAQTINEIHKKVPECTVEVLTPDFRGDYTALEKVFIAEPEIFSHNLECVERISKAVRTQSNWQRSLNVLKASANYGLKTKTGLMVGLGETFEEVIDTMKEAYYAGVSIFTIGQYLQPTTNHLKVQRYVSNEEFKNYKNFGLEIGFEVVESGALVRSSYHAEEQARLIAKRSDKVV
ncbi:MAG: lipoyl synthase [Candidatus Marinimicrobia bacterium]|nr:lipoyl synthase [Candidatus Neomarinimicrobiota bacterium]